MSLRHQKLPRAAFAIPGEITTLTGGYIYERRLLEGLRTLGHDVEHIQLAASFPDPSAHDMADAVSQLCALPIERSLILDGLVFGSIASEGLANVSAPIIAMIHHPLARESGLSEERSAHLFRTERDNLALASHVLVPSPHTAAILTSEYGVAAERITTARPGTDRPCGTSAPIDPPLILSVGIQHPRKGHDILLAALAEIRDLKWQAVIVGSPYDREHAAELNALRDTLGLAGRVRMAGRVSSDELNGFYRAASIFALATRYEGYGIVFDEALAYGLPIVSCDTGAVPDTVPHDAGLLVPPEAAEPFAEALRDLLDDTAKRGTLARASQLAGKTLPSWLDTARIAAGVLSASQPADNRGGRKATAIGRSLDIYYRDTARTDRMDQLNASFVCDGGLAFDIGAHVGDRTASFLRLGASVVAVEPQPRVFRALKLIHGRQPRAVLQCEAVGAMPGQIELHVNSDNPTISTVSRALINAAHDAEEWKKEVWDATIRVPVTTIDELIAKHGIPNFVKIDVEGHELEVLMGLSLSIPALSFEFTTIQRDIALACIEFLSNLGRYEFNISLGEEHQLRHQTWVDPLKMRAEIADLPGSANSGDVYARRI